MITEENYKLLKLQHDEACKISDYSKMIMIGDENYNKIKEYEREFICKHIRTESYQGGQIDRCVDCGKTWE